MKINHMFVIAMIGAAAAIASAQKTYEDPVEYAEKYIRAEVAKQYSAETLSAMECTAFKLENVRERTIRTHAGELSEIETDIVLVRANGETEKALTSVKAYRAPNAKGVYRPVAYGTDKGLRFCENESKHTVVSFGIINGKGV